jgi:hypothetical protein
VIPDEVILNNPGGNGYPLISSTANALLHLLGGYRVVSPFDQAGGQVDTDYNAYMTAANSTNSDREITFGGTGWKIIVDTRKIGEGPVINGKPRAPYLTLKGNETGTCAGVLSNTGTNDLPELIDAWGQPIIFVRRVREKGPIAGPSNSGSIRPQFELGGVAAYLGWPENNTGSVLSGPVRVGELQQCQVQDSAECGSNYSMLTADTPDQRYQTFAFLVRHPGVSPQASNAAELLLGSPRGTMLLLSAGPDGVFYSTVQGAGSGAAPVTNVTQYANNPKVWDEYDDIIVFAGG